MRSAGYMIQNPDLNYETHLWPYYRHIAGLDEAGRGALAGPVAVGAVVLPDDKAFLLRTLNGVRDSKQMTPLERESLAPLIKDVALTWSVGFASAEEIDGQGIVPATRLAALRALQGLTLAPQYLLTDFRLELPELDSPQTALVKGDALCLSIAAASVLAKTARDQLMCELDLCYRGYGLGRHKGYGTQSHRSALRRLGVSPIHRRSFHVKEIRIT
jgi:ribonuclease HII